MIRTRQLDEKDLKILKAIHADPATAAENIAKETGIPLSTVRKRVRALKSLGILRFEVIIHDHVFPHRAVISIDADTKEIEAAPRKPYKDLYGFAEYLKRDILLDKSFRPFRDAIMIERIEVLLGGRADILLFVASRQTPAILQFVGSVLRNLPGVRATNTAFVFGPSDLQGNLVEWPNARNSKV